ncbi:hypothetical protein ACH5RR_033720 [Cinchona calisaya]|uniref:Uncharacterized protein n=1 Tax=Cinchona calisaya TaxID=153742 RepID=A0ABD2Y8S4_9GENT
MFKFVLKSHTEVQNRLSSTFVSLDEVKRKNLNNFLVLEFDVWKEIGEYKPRAPIGEIDQQADFDRNQSSNKAKPEMFAAEFGVQPTRSKYSVSDRLIEKSSKIICEGVRRSTNIY